MEKILNLIGGELTPPHSQRWIENPEPATGQTYSLVPDSDEKDVTDAVLAAEKAYPAWSQLSSRDRSKHLRRLAEMILAQKEELARAECIDNGKPLHVALSVDIPRSALNFEYFADAITQFASEAHKTMEGVINYTLRDPLGVVVCISPWNLPLYLFTWKIAPALAAGNTVVAKPSEITPMTAYLFSKIVQKAGLPKGVLNIVHGRGPSVGTPLTKHAAVKAITFTGSTQTGALIAQGVASQFKKLSLEMGGKNASIIFADADLKKTAKEVMRAAFSNQGQICLCGSRILVQKSIYTQFKQILIEQAKSLKCGDPLEETTTQGALVSKLHFDKVLAAIDIAKKEGGTVLTGGRAIRPEGRCQNGWFIEPTLIEGLSPSCKTNQEEIFGPVATLIPFETEAEALEIANSTRYGLACSIWTRNLDLAHRIASQIQAGIVWINCWMLRDLRTPFGGMKDSGLGREGGLEALRFFTEPKNVCIQFEQGAEI